MKKSKNNMRKKIGKKILQILYILIKPFIPYIMIFLFIFFFIILIIDAIFIQFSDDIKDLNISEQEIERYCEKVADSNYEVYLDGKTSNKNINISSEETQKSITWQQIYTLLLFHNISDNKEVTKKLASQIASNFKSKYYYKTSTILTEERITDDEGNEKWEKVSEKQVQLITESITISGHYKYNYIKEIKEER